MASLAKFGALRKDFADLVDFVTIYIAEIHPAERGHFRGNYDIDTHKNMGERLIAAETLQEEAGEYLANCPILVDTMDDMASTAYAALPERLYVVLDGQIIFEGGIGPMKYSIHEVSKFLSKWK